MAALNTSAPIFVTPTIFERVFSGSSDDRTAKMIQLTLAAGQTDAWLRDDLCVHFINCKAANGEAIVLIADEFLIVDRHIEEALETAIPFHIV